MPPHPAPADLSIDRLAEGESPHAWRSALGGEGERAFDAAGASVLKEDGRTAVYRARMLDRDVVVKRWELPSWPARLRALAGLAPAHRHWRAARGLADHGLRTARPFALATEFRSAGVPQRVWLVMEALNGRTALEHLAAGDLPPRTQVAIARRIGGVLAELHTAGRFNRDGKPSNLLVTRTEPDPEVAVIDCVGIRRILRHRERALARMLASLYIEPLGCHCPPRRTLILAALQGVVGEAGPDRQAIKSRIRQLWASAAAIVAAHGDPTPRIDPLRESTPER